MKKLKRKLYFFHRKKEEKEEEGSVCVHSKKGLSLLVGTQKQQPDLDVGTDGIPLCDLNVLYCVDDIYVHY